MFPASALHTLPMPAGTAGLTSGPPAPVESAVHALCCVLPWHGGNATHRAQVTRGPGVPLTSPEVLFSRGLPPTQSALLALPSPPCSGTASASSKAPLRYAGFRDTSLPAPWRPLLPALDLRILRKALLSGLWNLELLCLCLQHTGATQEGLGLPARLFSAAVSEWGPPPPPPTLVGTSAVRVQPANIC